MSAGKLIAKIGVTDLSGYFKGMSVSPAGPGAVGRADLLFDKEAGGLTILNQAPVNVYFAYNDAGAGVYARGRLFGGTVARRKTTTIGTTKLWQITCQDWNLLLDKIIRDAAPAIAATGTFTFLDVLVEDDTLTINGVVFTAKDTPVGDYEFDVGTDALDQAEKVKRKLAASEDVLVNIAAYSLSADDIVPPVITVTHIELGTVGNAFTLAESTGAVAVVVSGPTLTGGAPGNTLIVPAGDFLSQVQYVVQELQENGYGTVHTPIDTVSQVANLVLGTMPELIMPAGQKLRTYLQGVFASAVSIDAALSPGCHIGTDTTFGIGDTFGGPVLHVYDRNAEPVAAFTFDETNIYGDGLERDLDSTGIVQRKQAVYADGQVSTYEESTAVATYPNPYQNHLGVADDMGYWMGEPSADTESLTEDEAHGRLFRQVAPVANPHEVLTFPTYEWVRPGDVIDLSWDLEGLSNAIKRTVEVSYEYEEVGVLLTTVTANARRLQLLDEDTELGAAPEEGDPIPPDPPTMLAVDAGVYDVTTGTARHTATWERSGSIDVTGYRLHRVQETINYAPVDIPGATSETTIVTLYPGVDYEIYVTAIDSAGNESTPSNRVSGTAAEPGPVSTPHNPGYETVSLTDPTQAEGWKKTVGGGGIVGRDLVVFHSGIASIGLNSTSGAGGTAASVTSRYVTARGTVDHKHQISLWARSASAGNYLTVKVHWYTAALTFISTSTLVTNGALTTSWQQFTYTPTAPGNAQALKVEIANNVAGSLVIWADDVEVTITPFPPTSVAVDAGVYEPTTGMARHHVTWAASPSTDVAGYYLYRVQGAINYSTVWVPGGATVATDAILFPGLPYSIYLRAVDTLDVLSDSSNVVTGTSAEPTPSADVFNPGYEIASLYDSTQADGWLKTIGGGGVVTRSNTYAHSGTWAIKLDSSSGVGGTSTSVKSRFKTAQAGVRHRIALWAKSAFAGNYLTVKVHWYTAAMAFISTTTLVTNGALTTSWQQFAYFPIAPATTGALKVEVANNVGGGQAIWADDWDVAINPPTDTFYNGSFEIRIPNTNLPDGWSLTGDAAPALAANHVRDGQVSLLVTQGAGTTLSVLSTPVTFRAGQRPRLVYSLWREQSTVSGVDMSIVYLDAAGSVLSTDLIANNFGGASSAWEDFVFRGPVTVTPAPADVTAIALLMEFEAPSGAAPPHNTYIDRVDLGVDDTQIDGTGEIKGDTYIDPTTGRFVLTGDDGLEVPDTIHLPKDGAVFEFPPIGGDPDSGSFFFQHSSTPFAGGEPPDEVMNWSYNQDPSGNQVLGSETGLGLFIEGHYEPVAATEYTEFQLRYTLRDNTQQRPIEIRINKKTNEVVWNLNATNFIVRTEDGATTYFALSEGSFKFLSTSAGGKWMEFSDDGTSVALSRGGGGSGQYLDLSTGFHNTLLTGLALYKQFNYAEIDMSLLFPTDNTYDIGASGATRPRDIHLGRDLHAGKDVYAAGLFYGAGAVAGLASQTVVLAKITGGGSNGSIVVTSGIVSAYTAPT